MTTTAAKVTELLGRPKLGSFFLKGEQETGVRRETGLAPNLERIGVREAIADADRWSLERMGSGV